MKIGQKALLDESIPVKIVGKVKWENPFSALNKKGIDLIVEDENGRQCQVRPHRLSVSA